MLLDAIEEALHDVSGPARALWIRNGGDAARLSFVLPHHAWFAALPHLAIRGDHLFVHAGVRPGLPLDHQKAQDLLWIRQPSLMAADHGVAWIVVHSHTPAGHGEITRLPHRIGIDTGASYGGPLIALRLDLTSI